MLQLSPILLALVYGVIMYRFSVWRTNRELTGQSHELLDPKLKVLTDRMAKALEVTRIRVHLYEIDPVNGLAAPDGKIYITRGFYRKFTDGQVTAEEMASVVAHELGHGVHQVLAAGQGEMLSSTPLTLAETASVFGEMLTFRKMLDGAKDAAERKVMLAGKVEDMINTVVRQIAFYDFECKLHDARAQGELTPDDINALWMSVQGESLGPAFEFMDGYETFWAYIPHFVHSPFYVYAYAFGDGLVNALYAVYQEQPEGFQEKYFDMLKAGGSKHHKELLAPFGLDASDPTFWDKGLSMISDMIDELEAMEHEA